MPPTVKHTKGFIRLVSKSKNLPLVAARDLFLVGLNGRVYVTWRTSYGISYRGVR